MSLSLPISTVCDLKKVLECPVCLRIPRFTPIYQCLNGHVICNKCHPGLSACPLCRGHLGKTRSLLSENVLKWLPTQCNFYDEGCEVEMLMEDLEAHEEECSYRPIKCAYLNCALSVAWCLYIDHLRDDHRNSYFHSIAFDISLKSSLLVKEGNFLEDTKWFPRILESEGRHFIRQCWRQKTGLWFMWIYFLGSPTEAEQFGYTIKITYEKRELAYTGKVISVDISREAVTNDGEGLIFLDSTAKSFLNGGTSLKYSVSVTKVAS